MASTDDSQTWTGTQTVIWPLAIVGIVATLAVVGGLAANPLYFLMLVFAILTIAFTKVRVDVSSSGVRVAFGPIAWPSKTIAIGDIAGVDVADIRPMDWGGWGSVSYTHLTLPTKRIV